MYSVNIALVGNPNSGLTTVFNRMTDGITHKGKYTTPSRMTKEGAVKHHKGVNVIELPGLYSLTAYSIDDISTRDILIREKPDVIVNVVDATSFERSLYLTLQLMELEMPMVIALNMMDEVRKNDIAIDIQKLSEKLTLPVIPISASKNQGIHELVHYSLEAAKEHTVPQKIDFCTGPVHTAIHTCAHLVEEYAKKAELPLRYCSTKIVEGDEPTMKELGLPEAELKIIDHIVDDMENHLSTDREAAMADMRYAAIKRLSEQIISKPTENTKERERSIKIDKVLTHRVFAIPIFFIIMMLVFYFTFSSVGEWLSQGFSHGIDRSIEAIAQWLENINAGPVISSLIIDGVCAGVGSVLSFVPRIAVLFFFLSILEDSGYMPRVAFVMDKLLRKIGLSGKSIVPMLIGFGCSVPAIMATRSLPSRRDRFLTITLIPFMSCSAKLPLYAMFTTAFFEEHRALVMMSIYLLGMLVSIVCALIFKYSIFKGETVPFLMVLPTYRLPALKSVWLRMWENAKGFIKKAFTIVFLATIVIWFLQSFNWSLSMVDSPNQSILASLGKFMSPVFAPLGLSDWRASTALVTGLSAKEAVVSTFAVLTGSSGSVALSAALVKIFSPLTAFTFMVFCLLYMPCVATLATVRREMNGWKYALLIVFFQTGVAWIVSFIVYQVGNLIL